MGDQLTKLATAIGDPVNTTMGKKARISDIMGASKALKKRGDKPPAGPGPKEMPDTQSQAAARRRSLLKQSNRRGRSSTVLTEKSDRLGG